MFDDGSQGRPLGLVQERSSARGLAVDQPGRAPGVDAQHPVAHALQGHAADPRGLGAGCAFVDRCQSPKTPGLIGITRLFGQGA